MVPASASWLQGYENLHDTTQMRLLENCMDERKQDNVGQEEKDASNDRSCQVILDIIPRATKYILEALK